MISAREGIRKRQREGVRYDRRERRRGVLDQSEALADGLLDALKGDRGLLSVFGAAGVNMEEKANLIGEYRHMVRHYLTADLHDGPEKRAQLEAKEDAVHASFDYKTYLSKGEEKPEFLKALDFMEHIGPSMRIFNMCTNRARPTKTCKGPETGRQTAQVRTVLSGPALGPGAPALAIRLPG